METENTTAKSFLYTTLLPTFGTSSLIIAVINLKQIHIWQISTCVSIKIIQGV